MQAVSASSANTTQEQKCVSSSYPNPKPQFPASLTNLAHNHVTINTTGTHKAKGVRVIKNLQKEIHKSQQPIFNQQSRTTTSFDTTQEQQRKPATIPGAAVPNQQRRIRAEPVTNDITTLRNREKEERKCI